jgi:O-antigen/teichoic acid export membrane protein
LPHTAVRASGRFDVEARTAVCGNLALFGAVAVVVWAGGGPVAGAAAFVVGRCGVLALSWLACARVLGARLSPRLVWPRLRSTLTEGFPFGVHTTIGTLSLQADTLMIQHYLGAQAVGIYQAGMRLLLGALLVADALNGVYLPKLARTGHAPTEFRRLGMQMTRHLLTIGVLAFACTVAGSDVLVHLLFKDGYGPLVRLLPGFGLLMFIRYGGVPYGTFLTLGNRQGVRVAAVAGVLLLAVGMNALLIPRLGLAGALVTSAVSHVVLYAVYVAAAWKDRGTLLIDTRSKGLVLAACVAAALLAGLAPAGPSVRVQLGAVLIVASILLGVTRAEWGVLSARLVKPA